LRTGAPRRQRGSRGREADHIWALAHRDALDLYRSAPAGVDWTYVSPAATVELGKRTGRYRTGGDQMVVDKQGQSRISAEDLASAILDEVEQPRYRRERFTVAY
jgi:uncharacterized protein